ncbi:NarK family nitrate/nitrite MFS transporter [Aquibacillus albus]|uniref:Nitrate/nitrite transporter n=1 Tax=Aquibacillus albus TaxID=1168171 RepID=A0ABS2N2H1_9BACI|nr:NarK family nitrate/nitrite MFS transporter [Aquibacillus albus]MBM7572331.1 NNP family nitrate/nitrite transporter-like MFS transporter [Aquibacillus albus]
MKVSDLFKFKNEEIKMLHLTMIAFFVSFVTWFNMAPLATTIMKSQGWLEADHLALLAVMNVALTIPARVIIGSLLDRFGPRIVFSMLLITMSIPTFIFAFGNDWTQLAISRLVLSSIGAGFVIGIRMVSEWFPPKSVGFAEGFYAGWGNFGSAFAAMTLPWVALTMFGGDNGWRYAIAMTGVICLVYGIIYFKLAKDTPDGKAYMIPKSAHAIEVSSWKDLIQLILWTIPLMGALALLTWRADNTGLLPNTFTNLLYGVLIVALIYQIIRILLVNVPILKKGVPEDDKYNFKNVAALNTTYFANFGAELAVVSMLPMFFEMTWGISATAAGILGSTFAFVNLFARPLGGILSDRLGNRKNVMLFYMSGITIGFAVMGLMNGAWPIFLAVVITILTSVFVQGAEGSTFAIIPMIKKRITGQIAGMAGAYGNVGSVTYLLILSFVTPSVFFFILSAGAFISLICCWSWLEEPKGSFADDYEMSSVDKSLADEPVSIPKKAVSSFQNNM